MRIISEGAGITHIEDLPVGEFIRVLRNMPLMTAQEKLDGAQLWVGVDEAGKLFASREGKRSGSDRKYSPDDWNLVSANNQFRAAHAALVAVQDKILSVLQPGDTVEAEVLFGRQPNSVTYGAGGKSYIAFLRGVLETEDSVAERLGAALKGQEAEAKVQVVDTEDGETLNDVEESYPFMFTTPQRVDPEKLKQAAQVEKLLKKLEAFLQEPSGTEGLSNNELLNTNLQKIPTDKRPAVKEARKALMELVMNEYKMPIKNALLDNVVRKIRSGLSDEDKGTGADIGIEGIVLRDQQTGEQIKIVDKDIFTAINTFNQSIRQTVQSSLTTVDPDSPLEQRGGLVGELRIRIAELFGNREMAKASNTRKVLEPLKGKSPEEAIENMAKSMGAIEDHEAIKKKILAMVSDTASQLKSKLEEFKANQKNYKLQLTNGKEISLSDDTIKRTLLTFAEARKNLLIMFEHLKATTTLAQILAVLYGGQAKAVHAPKIDEGLLLEKKVKRKTTQAQDVDRHEYDKRDVFQLVNSYLATVFMTMLVWHEDDKPGMRILRDRKNMGLKNWSSDMSPFNHWGYVIWRNNKPDLKKQLSKKVQHELFATTRQIQAPRWRFLHIDFSTNRDVKVDWADHRKTLQRLIDLTRLRSDRLNTLLDKLIRFPDLSHDEKLSAVKKLHTFAMQFVPRSVMLSRLKIIERALTNGKDDQMVTESKLLKSISALAEDEGGEGVYTQPVSVAGTTSAAIAPVQSRVAREATIIKRKRNPSVKRLTMKFPDPRKENE